MFPQKNSARKSQLLFAIVTDFWLHTTLWICNKLLCAPPNVEVQYIVWTDLQNFYSYERSFYCYDLFYCLVYICWMNLYCVVLFALILNALWKKLEWTFEIFHHISLRHYLINWQAYIIMMIADALAPNKCQAISNHHADSIVILVSYEPYYVTHVLCFNTLRPRRNGRHFADNILKCIFVNKTFWILNKISLKYVPQGLINNKAALVQIMDWRLTGNKPLFEPMLICFTDAYMRHSASMG